MNLFSKPTGLFALAVMRFLWITREDPFFWDAVQLGSKHAHFFYENELRWALLPAEIDSGHPPVFGYYLAWVWTVFGKTLTASHVALWPFVLGIVFLSAKLGRIVAGETWGYWLPAMMMLDPVVAGQIAGLGPDTVLLFFFLLAVYGLAGYSRAALLIGILGLCAVSMRGMMCAAALALWHFWRQKGKIPRVEMLAFVPGALFGFVFLLWHYRAAGWVGHHPGSPWAPTFAVAEPAGWVRNLAVLAWRWLDLGRWAEWVPAVVLIRKQPDLLRKNAQWMGLLVVTALLLSPSAILHLNLSALRYFLPVFVALHLLALACVARTNISNKNKLILLAMLCASLAFGNRWIYPHGVSMTWDSTLAHMPYHRLHRQMTNYLDSNGIPFERVGTAFPNINSGENLYLNGDNRIFSEIDYASNQYILISNVFNDINREDRAYLQQQWQRIVYFQEAGIWMELYQKKQ